ncbi:MULTISPECIES: hypothetical protein [unclassified Streptomyces]|uniref:hypothetical protein n=1 Tax=unclassified Streptomyces TaxID=2593676 RepID=UPI002E159B6B|nr:hypothetical protein OG452_14790 [Streptomyces sp. NBC_01197]WSS50822.1 hypothetical protein OG708_20630 [Streptomyces sp. NBC_01180]
MRGLTEDPEDGPCGPGDGDRPGPVAGPSADRTRRGTLAAGITAVAGLAVVGLFVAGCDSGGTGTRDEGAAHSVPAVEPTKDPGSAAATKPGERVNPVALLKQDPKVSSAVKRDLKPCSGSDYPVDVSYARLTNGDVADVVVNVMTCRSAVGVATYVYRAKGGSYKNVFTSEAAPVYSEIDRGDLVVTKQQYAKGDSMSYASSEDVITYHWTNNKFAQTDAVHTDFSRAVGDGDTDGDTGGDPATSSPTGN